MYPLPSNVQVGMLLCAHAGEIMSCRMQSKRPAEDNVLRWRQAGSFSKLNSGLTSRESFSVISHGSRGGIGAFFNASSKVCGVVSLR